MALIKSIQDTPAGNVIEILQRHGPLRIKDIEEHMGVTKTAVRQQLTSLMAEGLVSTRLVREGVGRPHYVYLLTGKARELFACYCDEVVLSLYEELIAEVGPAQVTQMLNRVSDRVAQRYGGQVPGSALADRVRDLTQSLGARGILADWQVVDGGYVLKEYNCPYHELAQEHREICEMEQTMMSQVLAADVELTQCMMDGHHGCHFNVLPRKAALQLHVQSS